MGLGVSLILIAVGAILNWGISATVNGVDLHAIGWILIAVGAIGAIISLVFWSSWWGPGYYTNRRRTTTYVEDGPPAGPRY
jgi:hypothetical protein